MSKSSLAKVQFPHTYLALQYANYVFNKFEMEGKSSGGQHEFNPQLKFLRTTF